MRKLAALLTVVTLCVAATAQADKTKPPKSRKPPKEHVHKAPKPRTAAGPAKPKPAVCVARNEGYNATRTLVSAELTAQGHGRYSGKLVVVVARANHRAPTGNQTYTLSNARVKFHHGVNPAAPAAGSRVKLSGKITELPNKHCPTPGFTPTITVAKADIRATKH
jgi:hypothetical protein